MKFPSPHWSECTTEITFIWDDLNTPFVSLRGGAENGQFCIINQIKSNCVIVNANSENANKANSGDIILEINSVKISGYTLYDINFILFNDIIENKDSVLNNHADQKAASSRTVILKILPEGKLSPDLRSYLSTRFDKTSPDHLLQQIIRDNLYRRTIPCTTRPPKPNEVNGVDYTFLSVEEFRALQDNGCLLESGFYSGNHYGTPCPPSHPPVQLAKQQLNDGRYVSLFPSATNTNNDNRRTSLMSKGGDNSANPTNSVLNEAVSSVNVSSNISPRERRLSSSDDSGRNVMMNDDSDIKNYIDNNYGNDFIITTSDNDLPHGWERINDPQYGVYYIDHVNKKTQYENPCQTQRKYPPTQHNNSFDPVISNDKIVNNFGAGSGYHTLPKNKKFNGDFNEKINTSVNTNDNGKFSSGDDKDDHKLLRSQLFSSSESNIVGRIFGDKLKNDDVDSATLRSLFTKNPEELFGKMIHVELVKSPKGFGFTIVGGDTTDEEFLQVKSVVPGGPAAFDGRLKGGDVLVFVNGICVLGFTHQDVVKMFQSLPSGTSVKLQICRGYPLPFDPSDPDNEIYTTVAVTLPSSTENGNDFNGNDNYVNSVAQHNHQYKYMDDGACLAEDNQVDAFRHLSNNENRSKSSVAKSSFVNNNENISKHFTHVTIRIVKGQMGFGFTIAAGASGKQTVKQILDKPRCATLEKADVIVQINGTDVTSFSHSQLVQTLKDCRKGEEAIFIVRRETSTSTKPLSNQSRSKSYTTVNTTTSNSGSTVTDKKTYEPPSSPDWYRTLPRRSRERSKFYSLSGGGIDDIGKNVGEKSDKNDDSIGDDATKHPNNYKGGNHDDNRYFTGTSSMMKSSKSEGNVAAAAAINLNGGNYDQPISESERYSLLKAQSESPPKNVSSSADTTVISSSYSSSVHRIVSSGTTSLTTTTGTTSSSCPTGIKKPNLFKWRNRNNTAPALDSKSSPTSVPYRANFISSSQHLHHQPPIHPSKVSSDGPWHVGVPPFIKGSSSTGNNNSHLPSSSTSLGIRCLDMRVTLYRTQTTIFGFRVIGGSENGTQVSVGEVIPGGSADLDGQIRIDDQIVEIDGISVKGATHRYVIELIEQASHRGLITLRILRWIPSSLSTAVEQQHRDSSSTAAAKASFKSDPQLAQEIRRRVDDSRQFPFSVTLRRKTDEGFGFVILSPGSDGHGRTFGGLIGRIIDGSPAARAGSLFVGDRILAINNVNVSLLPHEKVVRMMKESGCTVVLTIGKPPDDLISQSMLTGDSGDDQRSLYVHAETLPKGSVDHMIIDPHVSDGNIPNDNGNVHPPSTRNGPIVSHHPPTIMEHVGSTNANSQQLPPLLISNTDDFAKKVGGRGDVNTNSVNKDRVDKKSNHYSVRLQRGNRGYGFSIRGGREFNIMSIYVYAIAEGGPAQKDGRLGVGDEILQINGFSTNGITHQEALSRIQNSGNTLNLILRSISR